MTYKKTRLRECGLIALRDRLRPDGYGVNERTLPGVVPGALRSVAGPKYERWRFALPWIGKLASPGIPTGLDNDSKSG
jgi:hypothetical protein